MGRSEACTATTGHPWTADHAPSAAAPEGCALNATAAAAHAWDGTIVTAAVVGPTNACVRSKSARRVDGGAGT